MSETLVVGCLVLVYTYVQDYMLSRMLNDDDSQNSHKPK
ncbi:hypothetical protein TUMEXPCC7403_13790 [Tumidithrix helvetica PCC 7403]